MYSVAIVSPEKSLEPIEKVIQDKSFECHFYPYIYTHLSDIDKIYEDCRKKCDVIFFSGELGYHYILKKFPDIRIPCAFTAYEPIDVLSIFLQFQIEHKDIPLNRVFCDFLTETNHYMGVSKYIQEEERPYFYKDSQYDYKHITEYAKKLWDKGKIDMILSRSINNLKRLDELKIPYVAVFPNEEMIRNSIQHALDDLRLSTIVEEKTLSVLLRLPFSEEVDKDEKEFREAQVYQFLTAYRKAKHLHFSIEKGFNQFAVSAEISMDAEIFPILEEILNQCRKNLNFPFRLGMGLSTSMERSRYYAERALMESNHYSRNDAFFMEEEGKITGPLSQELRLVYNYKNEKALQFAKAQGIHESNILKLIGLYEQAPEKAFNAQSLAELLGITSRSASRILAKLLQLRLIREGVIEEKKNSGMEKKMRHGRPALHFHFVKENFEASFL